MISIRQNKFDNILNENKEFKEKLDKSEEKIRIATTQLEKNGYSQIWHICNNKKVKAYPSVLCSCCPPKSKPRDFSPYKEINQLKDKIKAKDKKMEQLEKDLKHLATPPKNYNT